MIFVRSDELKPGMRLARPIYNKIGVLLYERDTKLTMQGIYSVRNFGLIGIYVLEPAEPVPPMTRDDMEFERFQTMAVFSIKDVFSDITNKKQTEALPKLVSDIIRSYGKLDHKINFLQNIRSVEDEIYKHSLNVAILAALISRHMNMGSREQIRVVTAALLHESDFENNFTLNDTVKKIIFAMHQKEAKGEESVPPKGLEKEVDILYTACVYDKMTAMKLDKEPASEVETIRFLMDEDNGHSKKVVRALIDSINILIPGICVELTDGKKGLVLNENKMNILRPIVLTFADNKILDLNYNKVFDKVQIKDIMKSMDNRFVMDRELLEEIQEKKKDTLEKVKEGLYETEDL